MAPSPWIVQDQVPFDIFVKEAFPTLPAYYDSPENARKNIVEAITQFIERCQSSAEKAARQHPEWFYISFCQMIFNNHVVPAHYGNVSFTELPDWEGEGPLKECQPHASLLHFHHPMKMTDLARLPQIPIEKILLPLFLRPMSGSRPGLSPVEAQKTFAQHILMNTPRNFLVTVVIQDDHDDPNLQLWYHKKGVSIPSTIISFKDSQIVQPLYCLLWRLASMPQERQFGL